MGAFSKSKAGFSASVAMAALVWSGGAAAQELEENPPSTERPEAEGRNVIVVTAQKRQETLQEVPASVSAITGETLEERGLTTFDDYAAYIPGLNQQAAGGPGQRALILRGISAGNDPAATVGIYVDDVQFGSSSSLAAGGRLALDLVPFDLQRIEVLRGPQGTLYGASTLGGLFKYVTRAPDPSQVEARGQADLRFIEDGDTSYAVKAALNVPIAEDVAAIRATGFYEDNAGFVDSTVFGENINENERYGGRISLLLTPMPELHIRLTAVLQDIEQAGNATVIFDTATDEPRFDELTIDRTAGGRFEQEFRQYSGVVNYDFGGTTLTSITSYATFDSPFENDFTFTAFGAALGAPTVFSAAAKTDKFVQEVRLTSESNRKFEWIVGGFYTDEDSSSNQQVIVQGGPFQPLNPIIDVDFPSTFEEIAVFGSGTYYFTENFDLTLGIRYSENDQTNLLDTVSNLPIIPSSTVPGGSEDSSTTYLINPRWRVNDRVQIYARAASGYRPGGPNATLNDPITGDPLVPPTFEPDRLWNYELGIKSELLDRRLTANLAAFYIDWDDIQLIQVINGASFRGNGGGARSQGFEAELVYLADDTLTFGGNIAFTDAELTEDTSPVVGGADGDPLPLVPRWSGAVFGDVNFPLSGEATAFAGATFRYVDERNSNFAGSPSNPNFVLEDYVSLDLRAGVDFGNLTVTGFVRNLTDEIPQLSATRQPGFGRTEVVVGQPRSYGLTLAAEF